MRQGKIKETLWVDGGNVAKAKGTCLLDRVHYIAGVTGLRYSDFPF